ncbi:MAG: small basic protein [Planctomycetes bacterium]|nr:small basic protein [Planctomycetota bacterium]
MSVHKSLKINSALNSERSVFTRRERLAKLEQDGRWEEGESVYGLPKVRTSFKVLTKKQKKAQSATEQAPSEQAPAEGEE